MSCRRHLLCCSLLGILLTSTASFAKITIYDETAATTRDTSKPLEILPIDSVEPTQATAWPALHIFGYAGKELVSKSQLLWPLGGNNQNDFFYLLGEGAVANKDGGWSAGLGGGYRHVYHETYLLGGYLVADFNSSTDKHNFIVINPGVELLNNVWEARINGYVPATAKRYWYGDDKWAHEIGQNQYMHATDHSIIDRRYNTVQEIGMGLDGEVGAAIPHLFGLKAYVGGYHYFLTHTGAINGVEARVTFPIKNFVTLEGRMSHDKYQHNVFLGGVRFSIGGFSAQSSDRVGDVASRLLDPIEHNLASFNTGRSIPIRKDYVDRGDMPVYSGVYFFRSPNVSYDKNVLIPITGDGTAESPYSNIGTGNLDTIPKGSYLFFAPGYYNLVAGGLTDGRLPLPYGDKLYGRSSNFLTMAQGAVLQGGVDIAQGGNEINSMILNNDGAQSSGIFIQNADGTIIKNSIIGLKDTSETMYKVGISVDSSSGVMLQNTKIAASDSVKAIGLQIHNSPGVILLNYNDIYATSPGLAFGMYLDNASSLYINGDQNFITAEGLVGFSQATAIESVGSKLIINGNYNTLRAVMKGTGYARALHIYDPDSIFTINGNYNTLLAISNNQDADVRSLVAFNGTQLNINGNNNQITAQKTSAQDHAVLNGIFLGKPADAHPTAMYVRGNSNLFQALDGTLTAGNAVTAFYLDGPYAKLVIDGNNNQIIAKGNNTSSIAGGFVSGIQVASAATHGEVDINGNGNKIMATSVMNTTARQDVRALDFDASYAIFNINGSGNILQADGSGSNQLGGVVEAVDFGLDAGTANNSTFTINGSNNQIIGLYSSYAAGNGVGEASAVAMQPNSGFFIINGNNNLLKADSKGKAEVIYMADNNTLRIHGVNNQIDASSAGIASGIYAGGAGIVVDLDHVIFNVNGGTISKGVDFNAGIANATNLMVANSTFNIAGSGTDYGIYSSGGYAPGYANTLRNGANSFSSNLDTDAKKVGP